VNDQLSHRVTFRIVHWMGFVAPKTRLQGNVKKKKEVFAGNRIPMVQPVT
jgi:hypothetical protein